MNVVRNLVALAHDENGAVLAEYALILGMLSMISLTFLNLFGSQTTTSLQQTTSTQLFYEQNPP